jgi:hypothetical protein
MASRQSAEYMSPRSAISGTPAAHNPRAALDFRIARREFYVSGAQTEKARKNAPSVGPSIQA